MTDNDRGQETGTGNSQSAGESVGASNGRHSSVGAALRRPPGSTMRFVQGGRRYAAPTADAGARSGRGRSGDRRYGMDGRQRRPYGGAGDQEIAPTELTGGATPPLRQTRGPGQVAGDREIVPTEWAGGATPPLRRRGRSGDRPYGMAGDHTGSPLRNGGRPHGVAPTEWRATTRGRPYDLPGKLTVPCSCFLFPRASDLPRKSEVRLRDRASHQIQQFVEAGLGVGLGAEGDLLGGD